MLRDKKGLTLIGLIVALVVVLAIGFGIYKIFFVTKPLKIKHLEDMYIVNPQSSTYRGWAIAADYKGAREKGFVFGQVIDNANAFTYPHIAERRQGLRIIVNQDRDIPEWEEVNIPAGYSIELTYDGGQRLLVYLPKVIQEDLGTDDTLELYVASDGSTYYDEKLTQLAQSAP